MASEKLPKRFAGPEWRVCTRRLRQTKHERKKCEPFYQNTACVRCGGICFNLKMAVGAKKLMIVCTGCLKKNVFAYR